MTPSTRRRRWMPLVWLALGLAAGGVLFLDPGQWHPLDDHLRGSAGGMEMAGMDHGSHDGGAGEILFYRHPMDPSITSPVPSKDSMGMDYIPIRAGEMTTAAEAATVRIDPTVVQNMNVRTEKVTRRDLQQRIRSVGTLEFDQERMVTVTTKYSGFVERVYANYLGEAVRRGAPLFEIYSPELVRTQQELLSAVDYARRLTAAPAETRARAEALVDAARTRLGYWDIGAEQVAQLEATGEVFRTLKVVAPASGVIMMRQAGLEGMAVKPGLELFHIADLSTLWLSVELFEDQLAWIRQGTEADISLSYFPNRTLRGTVRFIDPEVSATTRTLAAKIEVPNPARDLRPGMFATILFRPQAAAAAVAVPSLAVLRTGQRNLVIVQGDAGHFTPREVVLGHQGEGLVQVLSGLVEGEVVVTSAQFLLDSEANLQAAIQKMAVQGSNPMAPAEHAPSDGPAAGMDHGSMDHGDMDHSVMDHSAMDHSAMDHGAVEGDSDDN